uniref:Uncharacterized protein n=1 Tax=Nelumbo nucifera TaxID=4432 RepID=A0A822Y963_NELNU|nr:TPA_asm: hypothetical protein HUJ06_030081 [Nelumbo nucifera]
MLSPPGAQKSSKFAKIDLQRVSPALQGSV